MKSYDVKGIIHKSGNKGCILAKDYSLLKSLQFERTMQQNCPAFHTSNSKQANGRKP